MSNKFIEDCEECQNMKKDGISFADAHWSLNPGYIQKPRGWVKSPHNNYAPAHQHEIVSIIRLSVTFETDRNVDALINLLSFFI